MSSNENFQEDERTCNLNQTSVSCLGMDRFSMFKMLINNALEKIASGVSEEQFADLFKDLPFSRSAPMKMQNSLSKNILESLKSEVDTMIEEENVEEKFKKLDELIDESALYEGKETWRPNGNVDDHIRSHAMEVKLKHKQALEEKVGEKEQITEVLKQEVSELRSQVREIEMTLNTIKVISSDSSVLDIVDAKLENNLLALEDN